MSNQTETALDIVGHYRCEGGDYRGDVVIRDLNDSFAVHWNIGGSVQVGIGIRTEAAFAVSVAIPVTAVVLYEIHAGPSLRGRYSSFPSGGPVSEEVLSFSHGLKGWEIGDHVLANYTRDPFWYPATVTEKADDDRYGVVFADGDQEWLGRSRIMVDLLTVGDLVYCTGGLLHRDDSGERVAAKMDPSELDASRISMSCRIIGREGDMVRLQYEDGTTIKSSLEFLRTLAPRES